MYERVDILGVNVSAINMVQALNTIERWITGPDGHYICVATVHGVMETQQDKNLQRIYNHASLVTPDGMPLVGVIRLQGIGHVERVYGPDLMLALCERSVLKG